MTTYVLNKTAFFPYTDKGKKVRELLDPIIVGRVMQQFREDKGISQEVLSGLAGIGRTHLSAIERGVRRPTLETFFRIAEALQIKPSVMMAEIEKSIDDAQGSQSRDPI